jgi:hypothetical protein
VASPARLRRHVRGGVSPPNDAPLESAPMRTQPAPTTSNDAGAYVKHARVRADSFYVALAEAGTDPPRSA